MIFFDIVDIIDLLAVVFDVCLIQYCLSVFFDNKFISKKFRIPIILVGTIIYYCSSIYVDSPYLRTVIYLGVCLLFSFCAKGSILKKLILVFLYAMLGVMVESIVSTGLVTLENNVYNITREDHTDLYISGVFLCNVLIFLLMLLLNFARKKFISKTSSQLESTKYLLFIIFIFFFISMFFGIQYLALTSTSIKSMQIFLVLLLMMVALAIMLFFMLAEMENLQTAKLENVLINERISAQEKFYKESIEKNQQLRTQVHDEKNLLLALKALLQNNNIKHSLEILNERLGNLSFNTTSYSGDIAIDTLLSLKFSEANKSGITIHHNIAVLSNIYISSLDLVLLLGNALDNSIDACKKLDNTFERIINLTLKTTKNHISVIIENPFNGDIVYDDFSKILTAKKDKDSHGFGLKSINFITQKYNGVCKIDTANKTFRLEVLLLNKA